MRTLSAIRCVGRLPERIQYVLDNRHREERHVKASRLVEIGSPLVIDDVPSPTPGRGMRS